MIKQVPVRQTKQTLTRAFSIAFSQEKVLRHRIRLNNGAEIPQIGLGTYSVKKPEQIQWALKYGYRHFDSGFFYGNEAMIAQELKKAEKDLWIPRAAVFMATKIPPKDQGYEKTKAIIEKSLKSMGELETIDLVLLTFPSTPGLDPKDPKNIENRHDSWKAMEEFVISGKVRSIGLANFKPRHIEKLLKISWVKPVLNQIETHPLYQEHDTIALCQENDIAIEAYSPLAQYKKDLIENPTITKIATDHGLDVSRTILAYLVQKGFVVIPRSTKEEHIASNIQIGDIQLTDD